MNTHLITTKILVAPRKGNFTKGETLTLYDSQGQQHSVVFFGKDGAGRSFVKKNGSIQSVYTYQLRR
ncbi:hypothetical protein [Spirosoma foliorum]|uniref:Uncharacterized protein n=1 Tax=Spirosoma foliorum TaxID=2710596 RepID=A0A7G5H2N8_9BACT|nr:hypothetical protein [Spirosoma foliorum]QMW05380.1 hypothetical protein H3H32_11050 [Spirosoma foliorum]